jgi:hypothetical protein
MTPSATRRGGRLYRYYADMSLIKTGSSNNQVRRIPAAQIEAAVLEHIRAILQSPEIIVATWRKGRQEIKGLTEREVADQLSQFEQLWAELFPAEQARIVQLLVERVDITATGADMTLRVGGLSSVLREMQIQSSRKPA